MRKRIAFRWLWGRERRAKGMCVEEINEQVKAKGGR